MRLDAVREFENSLAVDPGIPTLDGLLADVPSRRSIDPVG